MNEKFYFKLSNEMTYLNLILCGSTATSIAGTTSPSGAPEFNLAFSGVCVARSLFFCVVFCRSLIVLLAIVLSVNQFKASDYPFVIFKLLLRLESLHSFFSWKKKMYKLLILKVLLIEEKVTGNVFRSNILRLFYSFILFSDVNSRDFHHL
jgi:hypothetical protein